MFEESKVSKSVCLTIINLKVFIIIVELQKIQKHAFNHFCVIHLTASFKTLFLSLDSNIPSVQDSGNFLASPWIYL